MKYGTSASQKSMQTVMMTLKAAYEKVVAKMEKMSGQSIKVGSTCPTTQLSDSSVVQQMLI